MNYTGLTAGRYDFYCHYWAGKTGYPANMEIFKRKIEKYSEKSEK